MKYNTSSIPSAESSALPLVLVGIATLIGGFARLAAPLAADFPLNDGGLFLEMIKALQANHYSLPAQFSYNGIVHPFAYPPLGFYVTGLVSDLLRVPLLDVMRVLPGLVSILTIPAFYFLARGFLPSRITAALATFAFALLPRGFDWLIMGGGITRSFGLLFTILTLACAQRLFTAPKPRLVFWTSIWAALTVLTHPEAALQTAFAAFLMFLILDHTRIGFLRALSVVAITLLLTAPWWTSMLARHGIDPFLAAMQSPQKNSADLNSLILRLVVLFRFQFADEAFLPLLTVIGLLGMFVALGRRNYFLPVWLTAAMLFEPRSAPLYMILPLAMLAADALTEIILPALQKTGSKRIAPVFFGLILAYSITSAMVVSSRVANEITLQPAERDAMDWIKQNTPQNSVFLLLTGNMPLRDPVSEWFPVLTGRVSAATVFGHEWTAEPPFSSRLIAYDALQACRIQNTDCVQKWSTDQNVSYAYILLLSPQITPLQIYLDGDVNFSLIYRTAEVSIYQREKH